MNASTNKFVLGGIAAALIVAFAIGSWLYRPAPEATPPAPSPAPGTPPPQLIRDYSPAVGPAEAPVTVVEFLDPECESCAAMHPIVKDVMREFDGKVRLVVRYMPFHGNSVLAASLLEAARGRERYWQLMDTFFARQPEWADHRSPRPGLLLQYARDLGLDQQSVQDATRNADIAARIQQDKADGLALGVRGTPTFFVNGRMLMQLGRAPLRNAVLEALGGR
jgi:protein-disulfide isomerase